MNMEEQKPKTILTDSIMNKIESEQVCPRSKWSFQCVECWVWLMWGLSVLVGSLAFAVSLFVMRYWQYSLYEATHENFLTLVVDSLPFLWLVVFAVMVLVSLHNLRRTNTGYRHGLGKIVFSSVALSITIGGAMQYAGFGYFVDRTLGNNLDMYLSQDEIEREIWQAPEQGRLLGKQIAVEQDWIIFKDILDHQWSMDTGELHADDMMILVRAENAHIIGVKTADNTFTACGVLEWKYDSRATMSQLKTEKEQFAMRIYNQFSDPEMIRQGSVCAEAAMVRSMEKVLH